MELWLYFNKCDVGACLRNVLVSRDQWHTSICQNALCSHRYNVFCYRQNMFDCQKVWQYWQN